MKNRNSKLAVVFLSALIIGACGNGETNSGASSSSQSEPSSSEQTQADRAYQEMFDDATALYEAGKYSEAGGAVGLLLQNDLSDYPDLEADAKELQENIQSAQVKVVQEDETYEQTENSKYKDERNSVIVGEKFAADTGKEIKDVADEEIEAWLKEQETIQTESTAPESESTESEESESSTTESESSETETITPEQELVQAIEAVVAATGINPEENQFFSSKIDETTFQVEIRHSHEVDGVGISNMVGMYRYNSSSGEVQKMDPVTGEYQTVK